MGFTTVSTATVKHIQLQRQGGGCGSFFHKLLQRAIRCQGAVKVRQDRAAADLALVHFATFARILEGGDIDDKCEIRLDQLSCGFRPSNPDLLTAGRGKT